MKWSVVFPILGLVLKIMLLENSEGFQLLSKTLKKRSSFIQETKLNAFIPSKNEADNVKTDEVDLPIFIQKTNQITVEAVKGILSLVYGDRNFARFAALETIARVPYFSYTSVLHLYETFGWIRKKEYIQIHFAESWNELHHLLIMEELGGNELFVDRFVAQHIAFFYYWLVVALYMTSPAVAYDLNKHVERHAFATYDKFLNDFEDSLKAQPAPSVAVDYYEKGDLYMFDAFQYTSMKKTENETEIQEEEITKRRPVVSNLYDVFYNIRADEAEHADTMQTLQRDVCLRSRGLKDND